jgi:hypothetical protein
MIVLYVYMRIFTRRKKNNFKIIQSLTAEEECLITSHITHVYVRIYMYFQSFPLERRAN